jgi:hypothetical protein
MYPGNALAWGTLGGARAKGLACRPPTCGSVLEGSVLRVPVTPLLDISPMSTYTRNQTKQYKACKEE